jgi:hypothetical protein
MDLRDFLTRYASSLYTYTCPLTHHRTHLQDLIETTAQIHYEAFRSKQLLALKEGVNQRPAEQR